MRKDSTYFEEIFLQLQVSINQNRLWTYGSLFVCMLHRFTGFALNPPQFMDRTSHSHQRVPDDNPYHLKIVSKCGVERLTRLHIYWTDEEESCCITLVNISVSFSKNFIGTKNNNYKNKVINIIFAPTAYHLVPSFNQFVDSVPSKNARSGVDKVGSVFEVLFGIKSNASHLFRQAAEKMEIRWRKTWRVFVLFHDLYNMGPTIIVKKHGFTLSVESYQLNCFL